MKKLFALAFLLGCSTDPQSPPDAPNACAIARFQYCPHVDAAPSDAVDAAANTSDATAR